MMYKAVVVVVMETWIDDVFSKYRNKPLTCTQGSIHQVNSEVVYYESTSV